MLLHSMSVLYGCRVSCPVNYFKSSTIELSSPTFAVDCMSELYELYQHGICCDVVLSTGDCQTSAHKVVLMASSEYFKVLFTGSRPSDDFVVLPSSELFCLPVNVITETFLKVFVCIET